MDAPEYACDFSRRNKYILHCNAARIAPWRGKRLVASAAPSYGRRNATHWGNIMRAKLIPITAMALALLAATPATASDTSDVVAVINHYNDSFNKNDAKAADALCTSQTIIIDDFAPHAWQGASTCADWWNALAADSKKRGITEPKVTLGKAWHITVTGDRAYAVYSTHYDYKLNGKPTTEQGVWTFALQKMADGWRIAGWAWAQH